MIGYTGRFEWKPEGDGFRLLRWYQNDDPRAAWQTGFREGPWYSQEQQARIKQLYPEFPGTGEEPSYGLTRRERVEANAEHERRTLRRIKIGTALAGAGIAAGIVGGIAFYGGPIETACIAAWRLRGGEDDYSNRSWRDDATWPGGDPCVEQGSQGLPTATADRMIRGWTDVEGVPAAAISLEGRATITTALAEAAAATGAPDPSNPFAQVDHAALRADPGRAARLQTALGTIDAARAEVGLPPIARGINAMIDATSRSNSAASRASSLSVSVSLQPTRA